MVGRQSGGKRMSLEAGKTVTLRVEREVPPYGFFLSKAGEDILLPYAEARGELTVGDDAEVFLFHDARDRLTATMRTPFVRLGELALLEVADVHPRYGCFLEMGIGRQLLLPSSELPAHAALRPQVGDRVYIRLAYDKQGRMLAKAAKEQDLAERVFSAPDAWKNRDVKCRVYAAQKAATFVICLDEKLGFGAFGMIHESERTRPLRVGELLTARVAFVRKDGRVNLSMRPLKERSLETDAEAIWSFLLARPNGAMPYSDETHADVIREKFGISKSAFKRALGRLMKEGKVVQRNGWTYTADAARRE